MPVTNRSSGAQAGDVKFFSGSATPAGWLKANGALVSRTAYAALFAVIGTTYGAGDGATTFALPDYRGEFLRCADDGRGVDAGRVIGSAQAGQNASHTHTASTDSQGSHSHSVDRSTGTGGASYAYSVSSTSSGSSVFAANMYAAGAHTHNVTVNSSGGTEPRPRNVAVLACIKY